MKLELTKSPYLRIAIHIASLIVLVGIIVRIVLTCITPAEAGLSALSVTRALLLGVINDVCFAVLIMLPLFLTFLGLNNSKYRSPLAYLIEALLIAACVYVFCFHSIFHDYGGGAPIIAQIFFGYKLISFSIRLFVPSIRASWRKITVLVMWGAYVFGILFNAVGEYLFWDEFGVRYNFIAVDYLVYTNEVVGNIMESYSVVPLMIAIVALTAFIMWISYKFIYFKGKEEFHLPQLAAVIGCYAVAAVASVLIIGFTHDRLRSTNSYVTELQSNGGWDFIRAFRSNELDYASFYPLLPPDECSRLYSSLTTVTPDSVALRPDSVAAPRNIVLISVESLSASYLTRYGNTEGLTPRLDALIGKSMVFDSLYAVGNRTVRGLEALSICQPPTAGESIVKRPNNSRPNLSIGEYLRQKGYIVQYVYGGDSYFDNMGDYFSHNGYEIIDKKNFSPSEITFSNIWGVCDEDSYNKALSVIDKNAASGRPFFTHIMTVSNHRPFTYPEGKISMPQGKFKTREAGIKYTDYAIGRFLDKAASKPWFSGTVFIIIADHCASSAGKTSVPVYNYHIPCLVYSPGFISPQVVGKVCSQIDVMPSVLRMMGFTHLPPFTGQDIFHPAYRQRAFMATYQDLGYLEDGVLTVLSPVRRVAQFAVNYNPDGTTTESPLPKPRPDLIRHAQAFYQTANLNAQK